MPPARPGFLWMAGDRYGLDKFGGDGMPYSMLWNAWVEAGKVADMVVLAEESAHLRPGPPQGYPVERTFFGGHEVFGPA